MSPRPPAVLALAFCAFFSIATSEKRPPSVSDSAELTAIALSASAPGHALDLGITSEGLVDDSYVEVALGLALENHATESAQVHLYALSEAWDGETSPVDAAMERESWQLLDTATIDGALGSEPGLLDTAFASWVELSEGRVHLVLWLEGEGDITGEGQVTVSAECIDNEDAETWISVEVL